MNFPDFIAPYFSKEDEIYKVSEHIWGVAKEVRAQKLDSRQKEKKIIMISGLSGAGKDSIVDELIKSRGEWTRLKTLTTRPRRPEESEEDDPYERVSVGTFEDYLRKGQILEYTEYAGNFYGAKKGMIEKILLANQTPVLIVDPKGASFYHQKWVEGDPLFENATLIYLFVVPPSMTVLKERLLNRSRDPEFVEKRIKQSQDDITHIGQAEYIVINETGKLNDVVEQILEILS